ncbi:hypothetical protein BGY98DRAFT_938980 [Russula aff. rugulosa BPL654]|nr:hypothetical protein BGY98DRAFT_938980 [Russula aff. rugulosa BPL654]
MSEEDVGARMRSELDRSGSASSKDMSHRGSRCKPGDRNLGVAAMAAHKRVIRCLKKGRRVSESLPSADVFAALDHTREMNEEGKKGKKEKNGWHGLTRIVVVRSITGSRRASPPARVVVAVFESCMHADDTNGACCGFAGVGNISKCGNLDVDKVGLLIR